MTENDSFRLVRETLGDELLARLLNLSLSSVSLYASGQCPTPCLIGHRMEWLSLVSDDLRGGYNPAGVRAWFHRQRLQLDQLSPVDFLGQNWEPTDPNAAAVARLAAALRGPG